MVLYNIADFNIKKTFSIAIHWIKITAILSKFMADMICTKFQVKLKTPVIVFNRISEI